MKLGEPHTTVGETDARSPLHLPPSAFAVDSTKPGKFPDSTPTGNRLGVRNVAQNLEVHDQLFCHSAGRNSTDAERFGSLAWLRRMASAARLTPTGRMVLPGFFASFLAACARVPRSS